MIFNSILIANRGEIACRIIKTAKEMGIKSVAAYVDADKDALFVKQADQSVRLQDGGYLDGNQIIDSSIDALNDTEKSLNLEQLDDISKQIAQLINDQIKPAVASDGGNILFQSYDSKSKEVKVILQGACSGCPSSTYTLKNGIESMLKDYLPGKISNVVALNG